MRDGHKHTYHRRKIPIVLRLRACIGLGLKLLLVREERAGPAGLDQRGASSGFSKGVIVQPFLIIFRRCIDL
jgi:hypothetical protein